MTKTQFYRKICNEFFCFLGNVLIGVYTTYIQKLNNFSLVVCSPAYCLKCKPSTFSVYMYCLNNLDYNRIMILLLKLIVEINNNTIIN